MPLSIRATCDACKKPQAEDAMPSVVREDGAVALTPPRGWFVVATRAPSAASDKAIAAGASPLTTTVQLACSAHCTATLVRATPLEAPLAAGAVALEQREGLRAGSVSPIRRRGSNFSAPLPPLPPPLLATVRVVGPFAGNVPAAPLGSVFAGDSSPGPGEAEASTTSLAPATGATPPAAAPAPATSSGATTTPAAADGQ